MKTLSCYLLLLSASTAAASDKGYIDRKEIDGMGSELTVRTSEVPDLKGGRMQIEQRLDAVGGDSFIYDYHAQSEETKAYHRDYCATRGMTPAIEGESILTGASSGWACQSELQTEGSDSRGESVTDRVEVEAPTGSARVGANFFSEGYARVQSAQSGVLSSTVTVDNRCRHNRTEHKAKPFVATVNIGVNCIVDEARNVPTRMEACIPSRCGNKNGVVQIR